MNTPTEVATIENPFGTAPIVARPGGVGEVMVASREVAEVQTAMLMARRFPRDEVAAVDRILQACTRQSLAEVAHYDYARGGTGIRAPSIRLAECIAQYWGHLDMGWRVIEEHPGKSKLQTFCWDMQSGLRSQRVFDVTHERYTREGGRQALRDPRDIYEHLANQASRRLRACILAVIPDDVVEVASLQCDKTLATKVEVTPDRIKVMLEQFGKFGVTREAIERRIQRRLDAMTPGLMIQMGRILTSLRDEMSKPEDWFDQEPARQASPGAPGAPAEDQVRGKAAGRVKDALRARKSNPQASAGSEEKAPPPAPQPEPEPQPKPQGEPEPPPPTPNASIELQEVVRIAGNARHAQSIEIARQIAMQLTDEREVQLAQQHLDAAQKRIAG